MTHIVELQIEHRGEWWVLSRVRCNESEVMKTRVELSRIMSDWENSRCFDAGSRMRVHTT